MKTYTPTSYDANDDLYTLVGWKVVQSVICTLIIAIIGILLTR